MDRTGWLCNGFQRLIYFAGKEDKSAPRLRSIKKNRVNML